MNKQRVLIAASAIVIIGAFVVGSQVYQKQRATRLGFMAEQNFATFVPSNAPVLGSADAQVFLIEFTDPACETCAVFGPYVKDLVGKSGGRVQLVVRYAPFHHGSELVVKMLEATRKQGRFWEALDLMYKTQPQWASHHHPQPELLWTLLPQAGVDVERLRQDINDPEIARVVARDVADAQKLQVMRTPGFFVNGKPLVTFGHRQLEQLLQAELAAQYGQ